MRRSGSVRATLVFLKHDGLSRTNARLNRRHPYRQQGDRNRRSALGVDPVLGIVNAVLAIQPDISEKPVVEPVQAVGLRLFVLAEPASVQDRAETNTPARRRPVVENPERLRRANG